MPHFACIKMAESYKYIFDCTLIHLSTLKGIFECYAESDFVYDLSLDNRNIKKKVMPPLHTLMDEVLRGTIYAALNKAVKLAKEGNDKEVDGQNIFQSLLVGSPRYRRIKKSHQGASHTA